ncbi:CDP-glycerol glycerophosphotransferase family protein [Neobacillus novalis]|uniref:CDP-glycerol glycerophosphotransferase family protein n=1 Tax=Neobacillus novalis TaxID=220687 RepID=A0AA95MLW4_9BACI|nr:CDP-glycerol glycerophosphotransferase family protein [Neobacillus novalis]WHY86101.1 CDP-glycerol glycerophosphotransferase family protein [Neobacillus novalis]
MSKHLKEFLKPASVMKQIYKWIFIVVGLLPVRKKLLIFESFLGRQFSCNPRAIYEYVKHHDYDYEMIWSVDRKHSRIFQQLNIPYVNRFSLKWLWLLPRAEYWITNSRMPLWLKKPNHTTYVQTWHGTPLKKLAADIKEVHMAGTTTIEYKEEFLQESRRWDFLISPNPYSTAIFKRAFQYEKTILETGYPRNDRLITHNNDDTIKRIKDTLGIPNNKKVILYAPTWRDDEFDDSGKYKFTLQLDLAELKRTLSEEYVIILRVHYLIANRINIQPYQGFVFDCSDYDDNRDLYLISDILVTDYSSVFFDYLCLKRPIIFYTYDLDTYRDTLRGFYFDLEKDHPGPLVKTTEELIAEVKRLERDGFEPTDAITRFHENFCGIEQGVSTEQVVKRVFSERAVQ